MCPWNVFCWWGHYYWALHVVSGYVKGLRIEADVMLDLAIYSMETNREELTFL